MGTGAEVIAMQGTIIRARQHAEALQQTVPRSLLTAAWTTKYHSSDVEVYKKNELQLVS